jgi:glutamate carboxypeptidase
MTAAHSRIQRFLEENLPATLEFLRAMVEINSHTHNRIGVNQLGQLTAAQFAPLGFQTEFIPHPDPCCGNHLVLRRPGISPRTIAMISHLDTVFTAEEEQRHDFRWRPEGDRIYGPGTIDIKGGTAMMHAVLSAMASVEPDLFNRVNWLLLWNASEETLSRHFAEVCRPLLDPQTTLAALVFEAEGRSQGRPALVISRKGRATFRVTVEGRAAHAGAKHARGANAITQLAALVERIAKFTDYARNLTFNVGTIQGGTSVNRVPHLASAEVEMRAFDAQVCRDAISAMRAMEGEGDVASPLDGHRCRIRVELLAQYPSWPRNPATNGLFELWKTAAEELDCPLEEEARGGLSDGNWIFDLVPTLDGLGPCGDNDHCSERSPDGTKEPEYVFVPSIVPSALLHTTALRRLVTGVGKP